MDVDASVPPFTLSATLAGHEQDVRAVSCTPDGAVLTASRDSTVRVWRRSEAGTYVSTTLLGHTHYVIAVCSTPGGGIASGSNDKRERAPRTHLRHALLLL